MIIVVVIVMAVVMIVLMVIVMIIFMVIAIVDVMVIARDLTTSQEACLHGIARDPTKKVHGRRAVMHDIAHCRHNLVRHR